MSAALETGRHEEFVKRYDSWMESQLSQLREANVRYGRFSHSQLVGPDGASYLLEASTGMITRTKGVPQDDQDVDPGNFTGQVSSICLTTDYGSGEILADNYFVPLR